MGDYKKDLQAFYDVRDNLIHALNDKPYEKNPCSGCYEVKDGVWFADRRIRQINFNFRSFCNFKCSYCKICFDKIDNAFEKEVMDSINFFRYLSLYKHIDEDTIVELAAGEITVNPLRDLILDLVGNYPVWIFTNAFLYSEKIEKILAKGKSKLFSSVDAGTRETFAKIKGVDGFDKVCNHIVRYSQSGAVELKYIFLPGINDNLEDIDGVLGLCRKIGQNVNFIISRDLHNMTPLGDRTCDMIARLIFSVGQLGVNVSCPDWVFAGSDEKTQVTKKLSQLRG
jgi:molybdenum cofactor biosynthesis enzyme MoaA